MSIPDLRQKMSNKEAWQFLNEHLLSLPRETETVEFKTYGKGTNNKEKIEEIGRYFSALSNEIALRHESFGWLVLGVDNNRDVVGTDFQRNPDKLEMLKGTIAGHTAGVTFWNIYELKRSISIDDSTIEQRVVLFQVPTPSPGATTKWKGHAWARNGDALCALSDHKRDLLRNDSRHNKETPLSRPQDIGLFSRTNAFSDSRISGERVSTEEKSASPLRPLHKKKFLDIDLFVKEDFRSIQQLLEKHSRILIVGSAGLGKTHEIQRVMKQSADTHNPVHVHLSNYLGDSLTDMFGAGGTTNRLLLFDGLDQLRMNEYVRVLRDLESYALLNVTAQIVVASRASSLNLGCWPISTILSGFSILQLRGLDHDEIMSFLDDILKKDVERFLECLPRQVGDLLVNPFYLHHLSDLFRRDGTIPQNKAVVFQYLLAERWEDDVEHFRTTVLDLADHRKQAETLLTLLAVAMESLCRNWISHDEYLDLIPEPTDRRLLQHCGVWEKQIRKDSARWQFQHRGFQDYLAARRMDELPLDCIKELVAFGPDYKEIIPSWATVVGFMLDNTVRKDLIDWVLLTDPTIAIKADPSRISLNKRNEIFRNIYNNAKNKEIWIDRGKYPMRDLARFAGHRDNVEFLLGEAENPTSKAHLGNSIYLLRFMRLPYSAEKRVTDLFLKVALDEQEDVAIRSLALFALSSQKLDALSIVDQVVASLRKSENDWIRYSLYSFLHNSDHLDEHVDVFLEGIPFVRLRIRRRDVSRLMNESMELNEGINKVQSPAAIKKVFTHFAENPSDLDETRIKVTEERLFTNAVSAYKTDETVYVDAMKCFAALISRSVKEEAAMFVNFFEKTDTRSQAFKEVLTTWEDNGMNIEQALAMLADKDTLKTLVSKRQEGEVDDEIVRSVRNILRNTDQPDADWFQKRLIQEFGDEFKQSPPKDFDREQKNERQRSVDILFDRDVFLEHVRNVLDSIGKDEIAYDDISDLLYEQRCEHDHPHLVLEELTRLTAKKAISKDAILDAISQWDWKWFRISELHSLMSSGKPVQLSEEQADGIRSWCFANLAKASFRTAITIDGKNTTYKWLAIYLWFFFRKLDLDYPKDTLLDMVSFDYFEPEDYKGIEYLEAHLTQREMRNRVLDNLNAGIDADHVLKNHLNYCVRHNEQDGTPFARKIICDASMDNSVRRTALDLLVALAPKEFGSTITEISDSFKWNVVDEMVKMSNFSCRDHLMVLAKEDNADEKDNAICYLVQMGDLAGLQLYTDRTRELGVLVKKPWILEQNPLASFKDVAALPIFLTLLELSYTIDEEDDVYGNTLYRVVQDALTALALSSEQNHVAVQATVTEFIETHSNLKDVNFLHAFLERLETQYYHHKTETLTVHDVIKKLQKAGI